MERRMILFLLILLINLLIVIIYLLWNTIVQKEKNRSTWMKAFVMFICPAVGPSFFFFAYLLYKVFMSQAMDLEDVIFNKEKVETFHHPDEEMERNMVSIEEALAITDKKNLRMLIMNVIRGDYKDLLYSISKALDSEDTETAHYAASVLQDVLNEFRVTVQKRYADICEETESQAEKCLNLIEYMNPVLEQRILTNLEQHAMVDQMDEIGQRLYENGREQISSEVYEMLSLRLLEVKEYDRCKIWCERAVQHYPNSLASYTCQLKLYFSSENKKEFQRVMQELKQSDITIDYETLQLVRTFM